MKSRVKRQILTMVFVLSMILTSVPPLVRAQDAGHASFVRQVVPILLGRKVKGQEEVKLLADLCAAVGREAVVRALMEQPEFVDHWAEHFVDQLRVHRETAKAQTNCFGRPKRSGSDGGALARWVRDSPPTAGPAPGGPFNMSDLYERSFALIVGVGQPLTALSRLSFRAGQQAPRWQRDHAAKQTG